MLKSKPIGWITAGTLVCLAVVALACRLRDGKGVPSEANAAPCPIKEEIPPPQAKPTESEASTKEVSAPPKPQVREKVEDNLKETLATQKAKVADEKTEEAKTPTVPSFGVAADSAYPVSAPPRDPAPPPPAPGSAAEEKAVPKPNTVAPAPAPSVPLTAEAPEPKSDPVEKPAPSKPMPPGPGEDAKAPATPAVPAVPTKEVTEVPAAKVTGVKPREEPATPAPAPVAATSPPPEKPMPTPHWSATGEPSYKVGDKGETLREIAKRTLGSEERWTEIDKLNPDLRSESVVPAGKVVRLPVDARSGWNEPGGAETQATPPSKALSVRPLPVVRPKRAESKAKIIAPLTGTYSGKLDKRSLVLPKEVCEQLGKAETVLLTPGPDQCLWLGTQASAARVLEGVEKSGAADQEVQTFRRLYFSQSEKATLDSSGKLAISAKLAEYAGLGKEVVLIGIDDHFELWDAGRWQRYSQHKDASPKP